MTKKPELQRKRHELCKRQCTHALNLLYLASLVSLGILLAVGVWAKSLFSGSLLTYIHHTSKAWKKFLHRTLLMRFRPLYVVVCACMCMRFMLSDRIALSVPALSDLVLNLVSGGRLCASQYHSLIAYFRFSYVQLSIVACTACSLRRKLKFGKWNLQGN